MNKIYCRISITHKFITEPNVFVRGKVFSAKEIINLVILNDWYRNDSSVRSAINEGILMGRIKKVARGRYVFS
jgi:hypothetical protein